MRGKPLFKRGDRVQFELEGRTYHGNIYIVDEYGTWDDPSDVSYDVMVDDWGDNYNGECLVKHLNENMVHKA